MRVVRFRDGTKFARLTASGGAGGIVCARVCAVTRTEPPRSTPTVRRRANRRDARGDAAAGPGVDRVLPGLSATSRRPRVDTSVPGCETSHGPRSTIRPFPISSRRLHLRPHLRPNSYRYSSSS